MYWQNEEAKQPKVSFRDLFCETIKLLVNITI